MLKVRHGKVERGFERVRVAYVANVKGLTTLQFISSNMMLKRYMGDDHVPKFGGPVYAGWDNLRETYPETLHELELIGALAAIPDGDMKGHIDWVKPVDGGKVMEMRRELTKAREPVALTHESLSFPVDLKAMAQDLMFDGQLNVDLRDTTGGADIIECILRAAVRYVKGEA